MEAKVLRNDLGGVIIDFGIWSDIDEYLLQESDTHLITLNSWIFKKKKKNQKWDKC